MPYVDVRKKLALSDPANLVWNIQHYYDQRRSSFNDSELAAYFFHLAAENANKENQYQYYNDAFSLSFEGDVYPHPLAKPTESSAENLRKIFAAFQSDANAKFLFLDGNVELTERGPTGPLHNTFLACKKEPDGTISVQYHDPFGTPDPRKVDNLRKQVMRASQGVCECTWKTPDPTRYQRDGKSCPVICYQRKLDILFETPRSAMTPVTDSHQNQDPAIEQLGQRMREAANAFANLELANLKKEAEQRLARRGIINPATQGIFDDNAINPYLTAVDQECNQLLFSKEVTHKWAARLQDQLTLTPRAAYLPRAKNVEEISGQFARLGPAHRAQSVKTAAPAAPVTAQAPKTSTQTQELSTQQVSTVISELSGKFPTVCFSIPKIIKEIDDTDVKTKQTFKNVKGFSDLDAVPNLKFLPNTFHQIYLESSRSYVGVFAKDDGRGGVQLSYVDPNGSRGASDRWRDQRTEGILLKIAARSYPQRNISITREPLATSSINASAQSSSGHQVLQWIAQENDSGDALANSTSLPAMKKRVDDLISEANQPSTRTTFNPGRP